MTTGCYTLPPPAPLKIHSDKAGERCKCFKRTCDSYALATGLSKRSHEVHGSDVADGHRKKGAESVFNVHAGGSMSETTRRLNQH